MTKKKIKIYFSDFFEITHQTINSYGALDISLISDNPAFVDPFLIFFSKIPEYIQLHKDIIRYLGYLKDQSEMGIFEKRNFIFPEVKEVWLGYSRNGNGGLGLNHYFAITLKDNFQAILDKKNITQSSHLEKVCLIGDKVGADKISDFTLNLIKGYLIEYTQTFANKYINKKFLSQFNIPKAEFDYDVGEWKNKYATLPFIINKKGIKEFVLLTPKNILVKECGWINKNDYLNHDTEIFEKIEDESLREKINKYFLSLIPKTKNQDTGELEYIMTRPNTQRALINTTHKFPILLDYYIREKENNGLGAIQNNKTDNIKLQKYFYDAVKLVIEDLDKDGFYNQPLNSYDEVINHVKKFKWYLENRDGYKIFWDGDKLQVKEKDVQIMFDFILSDSNFSIDKEVNNGRGPVDFKVSKGKDNTLVEVKLANNPQIENNLKKQLLIYMEANDSSHGVYVIAYFSDNEKHKLDKIIKKLGMNDYLEESLFLIDCRKRISASKAK